MKRLFVYILKVLKKMQYYCLRPVDWLFAFLIFYMNDIKFTSFPSFGIPKINLGTGGKQFRKY